MREIGCGWGRFAEFARDRYDRIASIETIEAVCEPFWPRYFAQLRGGMLPSPSLGDRFGVPVIRERIFGQDYAKTLAIWRNNFRDAWPALVPLGFDDRFRRLWGYYLAYCEAGFLSGNIDVRQVIFAKQQ